VARLASLSSENWSEGFAGAWSMLVIGAELPVRFIEGLGAWAASAFQRFHPPPPAQPPPPEPPDGCFDALDPSPLVRNWLEGRQADGTRRRIEAEAALASRDDDRRALQTTTKKLAATTSALEAAEQTLNAVQSELKLHSQASTNAQQQVQMVRAAANQLMEALLSRNKAHDQAIEQREAAEARATEAEQARDALDAELDDLRRQLHDRVDTSAEALAQARSQLDAERQRRSNAESLAAARGQKIEAQKTELANLRQIVTQLEARRAEPAESERLAEVQKELDDLRQAQAADAAHIRELIEADRFPEVLSFFVSRILGVPVKDGDHALALLEEKHPLASARSAVTVAEHPLPPEPLLPTANAPNTSPSRAKIGRNEPCPCGSGKKYKRCCWLSSS